MLLSHSAKEELLWRECESHSLGDEQADFPHAHQFGPALHRGRADVRDDAGEGRVLLGGQNYQHGDGVAVIRQLNHLVLQSLRRGGDTLRRS